MCIIEKTEKINDIHLITQVISLLIPPELALRYFSSSDMLSDTQPKRLNNAAQSSSILPNIKRKPSRQSTLHSEKPILTMDSTENIYLPSVQVLTSLMIHESLH